MLTSGSAVTSNLQQALQSRDVRGSSGSRSTSTASGSGQTGKSKFVRKASIKKVELAKGRKSSVNLMNSVQDSCEKGRSDPCVAERITKMVQRTSGPGRPAMLMEMSLHFQLMIWILCLKSMPSHFPRQ